MKTASLWLATLFALAWAAVLPGAVSRPPQKRLIEFGWDEPDTAFMRRHAAEMEQTPFDGCVFHLNYMKPDGSQGSFTWECWGARAFTRAELEPALADLRAAPFRRFRHNFLRFNTTPGDVDWFGDFGPILANAELAARIARQGRCPGILFDIEQYNAPLFRFQAQRDAERRGWDAYAAQVRRRGREVMDAFQKGFPGLRVFLTFGYSLPWVQSQQGRALDRADYGLLAPFLDGMVEAARGRSRLIEGFELAYGYRTVEEFDRGSRLMRQDVLPIVADPARFRKVFSFGFGLWLDHDWRRRGWNETDPARNYRTPEGLEECARWALQRADEYVWIYSETPRWWTEEGRPAKLPAAYAEALRRAREGARQ